MKTMTDHTRESFKSTARRAINLHITAAQIQRGLKAAQRAVKLKGYVRLKPLDLTAAKPEYRDYLTRLFEGQQ